MKSIIGRRLPVLGHEGRFDRALRIALTMLREIFDERAWERFTARKADGESSFNDFLAERHGHPRQRCC